MKSNRIVAAATIGIAVLVFTGAAQADLINFDTDTNGNPLADGTQIDSTYASLGVNLGCFPGTDVGLNQCSGDAFARASTLAESAPNVIGLTSTGLSYLIDERFGFFRASFSVPVNSVSIDAMAVPLPEQLGTPTNAPFLQAFAAGGIFLGEAVYPNVGQCDPTVANSCPWQTLTVNVPAATPIAFVAFSSFHSGGGPTILGIFDNLAFAGPGPRNIPEPATLYLVVAGLIGLARLRALSR